MLHRPIEPTLLIVPICLLRHLVYYVPIDPEVRKGSFGVYFHSLFLGLSGKTELIGPLQLEWDDNHQTWQAVGLVGYRWKGWGVHWNLQVGYRAMRLFDLRRGRVDTLMDARGADIVVGVEF